jgi:cytochrome c peroxidase
LQYNLLHIAAPKKILKLAIVFLAMLVTTAASWLPEEDTKITAAQQMGRYLFFDKRLSSNGTKSCASCHNPQLYFTDGYRRALGAYADVQMRNTPTLINSVNNRSLGWASYYELSFEQQMLDPLFRQQHQEMGMDTSTTAVLDSMFSKEPYKNLLPLIEPQRNLWQTAIKSIAAYESTIVSYNSPYDKFLAGDSSVIDSNTIIGMQLFNKNCKYCHGGKDFNEGYKHTQHEDNRLYSKKQYKQQQDKGMYDLKLDKGISYAMGSFRIPTLRNCAQTDPYMHDGSIATLQDVLKHYNKTLLKEKPLSALEQEQIIAFLYSLTDTTVLTNTWFNSPWTY